MRHSKSACHLLFTFLFPSQVWTPSISPPPLPQRYVSALQVVDKALGDDSAKGNHKELQVIKGDLLGRMGWRHLVKGEEEAIKVRFPKAFQPF